MLDAIIGSMSNPSQPNPSQAASNRASSSQPKSSQVVLPRIARERLDRIQARTARIGVIGLGYVGLPLSLLLAEAGFKVTGFDIDAKKVDDLEAGRSYIFRIAAAEIEGCATEGI